VAEASLVALGSTRRPSEGGQTLAQLRAAQAAPARAAAGIPEGYTFAPQEAPAATAEDIAWARQQQERPRTRVAAAGTPPPATPYVAPSTVSTTPSAVPPSTTATGKTAPTAADIAAAPWRYGAQPAAAAPGQPPLQQRQAGIMPSGTLASIRAWMNPTDKPVYLRPWFLATGATAVGLLTYVGYQSMAGAPEEEGEG
jgi:hypothetical protein